MVSAGYDGFYRCHKPGIIEIMLISSFILLTTVGVGFVGDGWRGGWSTLLRLVLEGIK